MKTTGVRRIVAVSAAPVGTTPTPGRPADPPGSAEWDHANVSAGASTEHAATGHQAAHGATRATGVLLSVIRAFSKLSYVKQA